MGCIFDSNTTPSPVPPADNAGNFRLIPNDGSPNDSCNAHLADGIVIPSFPGAKYQLSFTASDALSPPKLRLYKLFKVNSKYGYTTDQVISGSLSDGKWVYDFTSNFLGEVNWLTVLERSGERFTGVVKHLHVTADGVGSGHLSFNLWVTGAYFAPSGNETALQVANALLAGFRYFYSPSGVVVDSVYVLNAADHPLMGKQFPAQTPLIATGLENRFDSLGYGLSGPSASSLDLVLVKGFSEQGMLGESPLLGLNLMQGETGSVVIATQRRSDSGVGYVPVALDELVTTAAHEVGHFFGLRHTTATSRDRQSSGDYSDVEDGLSDTPVCTSLPDVNSGYSLNPSSKILLSRIYVGALLVSLNCPDQQNLMFPYAIGGTIDPLSAEQGALLLRNLRLFPRT